MSSIDLFLLVFVMEKPISAYDLAKLIDENHLSELVKISRPAVYKNLLKLHQKGYVSLKVEKQGSLPEKKIYSMTTKGRAYFNHLMHHHASKDPIFHLDFNPFFLGLGRLPKREAMQLLHTWKKNIENKNQLIKIWQKEYSFIPFEGRILIQQYAELADTLVAWIHEYIKQYPKERR